MHDFKVGQKVKLDWSKRFNRDMEPYSYTVINIDHNIRPDEIYITNDDRDQWPNDHNWVPIDVCKLVFQYVEDGPVTYA